MEPLYIDETEDSPEVILDAGKEHFEIKGRSFPEDANEFYDPIVDWVQDYLREDGKTGRSFEFDFSLEYINTASFRQIYKLMLTLSDLKEELDSDIEVNWYYPQGDKSMKESGERFQRLIQLPVNLEEQSN